MAATVLKQMDSNEVEEIMRKGARRPCEGK